MSRRDHAAREGQQTAVGNGQNRRRQHGATSAQQGSTTRQHQQHERGQANRTARQSDSQQSRQPRRDTAQPVPGTPSIPTGFRLISLTFAGIGLALLAGAAIIVQGANAASAVVGPVGSALLVVGLLFGALGVGHLAAGYGTWTFRPWAQRVGLFIASGSALGSATILLMGSPVGLLGLLMHGGIAWYLHTNRQQYAYVSQMA